jgi:hydroxymethylglutaryl-CoA synthase
VRRPANEKELFMKPRIGIHALGIAVPRRYIEMDALALARGVEPAKYLHGLGALQMAVAEPGEDTVALAAVAARRALAASGLDRERLGLLIVGTETGVDHSKPVASFVHGLLGLPQAMRVYDTQHACYGGTAGLMAAVEWIASGAADDRAALVICADIARYGLGTPGEPTQGAGAVAMVVSTNPALLELDVGVSGAASSHVHDFWRPLGLREAQVDGHYSVQCYLDAVATAYRGWRARATDRGLIARGELASSQLARICYHVPFCKMARKAHLHVRRCDLDDAGAAWRVADEEAAGLASYAHQVEPSLGLCAQIGNIYTGSLYLGLAGLLQTQAPGLVGQRIGLFSYGSGCTSEFFSGVVAERAAAQIAAAKIAEVLAARERISIPEYERIMALPPTAPLVPSPRPSQPADGELRFIGVSNHQRQYATR